MKPNSKISKAGAPNSAIEREYLRRLLTMEMEITVGDMSQKAAVHIELIESMKLIGWP